MQEYVNHRAKAKISPMTIRMEIATLRAAWNWGEPMELTEGKFPNRGLRYPKADEKPPFMTMAEIERQLEGGGDPDTLWEALYLQACEVAELLAHVKDKATHPWIYPLFCFAAHAGARRSEITAGARRRRGFHRQHRDRSREEANPRPADHPPRTDDAIPQGGSAGMAGRSPRRPGPVLSRRHRRKEQEAEPHYRPPRTKRNARRP